MKRRARALKQEITAIFYAYKNPKVKWLPRLIIIFTIGYALSPVDLVPDFIPVLGYIDDLIILPALISLSIKLIPKDVMEQSRIIASENPVSLKKNTGFAIFFILIWIAVCFATYIFIKRWMTK